MVTITQNCETRKNLYSRISTSSDLILLFLMKSKPKIILLMLTILAKKGFVLMSTVFPLKSNHKTDVGKATTEIHPYPTKCQD